MAGRLSLLFNKLSISAATGITRCVLRNQALVLANNTTRGFCYGKLVSSAICRNPFRTATLSQNSSLLGNVASRPLLQTATPVTQTVRTRVRISWKGKPRTVQAVPARFFRLNSGMWIRTKAGRAKHLWKKTGGRKRRAQQHVLVTRKQGIMLDKMVNTYWKRPKYWENDPYKHYHKRANLPHFRYLNNRRPFYP